jgi:hypothetical protein
MTLNLTVTLREDTVKALEELIPGYEYGNMGTPEMLLSDLVERNVRQLIRDEQFRQGKITRSEYLSNSCLTPESQKWIIERYCEGSKETT